MTIPRSVFDEIVRLTRKLYRCEIPAKIRELEHQITTEEIIANECNHVRMGVLDFLKSLAEFSVALNATDAQIEAAYRAFGLEIEEGK